MPVEPVFRLSDVEIRVISDGSFLQDAGTLFGVVPKVMWERVTPELNERNQIPLALNCLLIRGRGQTVLVETGMGNKLDQRQRTTIFPGDYGHLLNDLAAAGVQPEDVTCVVNTHLHADHCGWNTVSRGGRLVPTFPNARYFVQRGEYEVAMHPNERTRATYLGENFAPLLEAGQLNLIDGEEQVTPEVRFLPSPGHTADHACVAVTVAGEHALYTGDLVHSAIGLERLPWIPALDVLPLVSLETKRRLTERMIRERTLIAITHAPFPGVGRLSESEGRRQWTPEPLGESAR
jgi:glyoxylase-like metal-dependent hydrolase (beta-lactamase superfamily II)